MNMDSGAKVVYENLKDCLGKLRAAGDPKPMSLTKELESLLSALVSYHCAGEIRVAYEGVVLPFANLILNAGEAVASVFIESLNWYLADHTADELARLQTALLHPANSDPKSPPNMNFLLSLYSLNAPDNTIIAVSKVLATVLSGYNGVKSPVDITPIATVLFSSDQSQTDTLVRDAVLDALHSLFRTFFSTALCEQLMEHFVLGLTNTNKAASNSIDHAACMAAVLNKMPATQGVELVKAMCVVGARTPASLSALQTHLVPALLPLAPTALHTELKNVYQLTAPTTEKDSKSRKPAENIPEADLYSALKSITAACKLSAAEVVSAIQNNEASLPAQFFRLLTPFSFDPNKMAFDDPDAVDVVEINAVVQAYTKYMRLFSTLIDEKAMSSSLLAAFQTFLNAHPTFKDVTGPNNLTLLYISCRWGYVEMAKFLLEQLNCDPNFNSPQMHGSTALHGACWGGHLLCVSLLLSCGASVAVVNGQSETPLSNAQGGHGAPKAKKDIIALLRGIPDIEEWEFFNVQTTSWHRIGNSTVQTFINANSDRTVPFVLPTSNQTLDPVRFTLATVGGSMPIRRRQRNIPRGVVPRFEILMRSRLSAGFVPISSSNESAIRRAMAAAASSDVTLNNELPTGEKLVIKFQDFSCTALSSNEQGWFRWLPHRHAMADSAAALGLVDGELDDTDTSKPAVPHRPALPPARYVVLTLKCGAFASDLASLAALFKTPVELVESNKAGEVKVITTDREVADVAKEIAVIEAKCSVVAESKKAVLDFAATTPVAPTTPQSVEISNSFPISDHALLVRFLLTDTANKIVPVVLKAYPNSGSNSNFRIRVVMSETDGQPKLEACGSQAQVNVVGQIVSVLNYVVSQHSALKKQGHTALENRSRNCTRLLLQRLQGSSKDIKKSALLQHSKFFYQEFRTRLVTLVQEQQAVYDKVLENFLRTKTFPAAVSSTAATATAAAKTGRNQDCTLLLNQLKDFAATAQQECIQTLHRTPMELNCLKATLAHMSKDIKCTNPKDRVILDEALTRLLASVPTQIDSTFWTKIPDLLISASIQVSACGLNLPLYARSQELLKLIRDNDIVSIHTCPGTGKTTLVPVLLLSDNYSRVCVTQPRRLPCHSVGRRVLSTFDVPLCGWAMAGEQYESKRPILYLTDGLMREWLQGCMPTAATGGLATTLDFDVIFLDEIHERGWHTDVCMGLLASMIANWKSQGKNIKIILASATLDPTVLQPFEAMQAKNQVKIGRFSLDINAPFPVTDHPKPRANAVQLAVDLFNKKDRLDQILVFMPSVADVRNAAKMFEKITQTKAHMLYANQESKVQKETIESGSVFFSTTIAETSLTFPHLRYVIDTGEANIAVFDTALNLPTLGPGLAPTSTLLQRRGRLGRTLAGEYYSTYEPSPVRSTYPTAQILSMNVVDVEFMLRLRGASLSTLRPFLPSPPSPDAIALAEQSLKEYQLCDANLVVTPEAKLMPVLGGVRMTAATLAGLLKYNCGSDMLMLAAMLRAMPSDCSIFFEQIPTAMRAPEGDIMTLLNCVVKMVQYQHSNPTCKIKQYALTQGFREIAARTVEFAVEHYENFQAALKRDQAMSLLAQKSGRKWKDICMSLMHGYGSFIFCSQQQLHGAASLYTAYTFQRPHTLKPVYATGAPAQALPPDVPGLLSFDSLLSRKPGKEQAVPWVIALSVFYTPKQQNLLTLSLAGEFDPSWSDRKMTRRVIFANSEQQCMTEAVALFAGGGLGKLGGNDDVVLEGTLSAVSTAEMQIYKHPKVCIEEVVEIKADSASPPDYQRNIEELRNNFDLFKPFIWRWKNEHQVTVKVNTNVANQLKFTIQGRLRKVNDAKREINSFARFLRETAVVTLYETGKPPVRIQMAKDIKDRLRRVTDVSRTDMDLWQWSKGAEATRATRMEVVAWVAVVEFGCRLEGGFVRDWVVRGEAVSPNTKPSDWIEWDAPRGRYEVIEGVGPKDLDMELPFKYVNIELFLNRLRKLGFTLEEQSFVQGYNFLVDLDSPLGPFTLDLIYPHNVATHDRVDFDVNNLYCERDHTAEFGMRVDISEQFTTSQIVDRCLKKEFYSLKSADFFVSSRTDKMKARGWKKLGEIPLVPNRGPKFGASFLPLSAADEHYKQVEAIFKAKLPVANIKSIHQISAHNLDLLYKAMRAQIEMENGGNGNEMLLFHGTRAANAQGIMDSGFDNRYWHGGLHGHGAYFADDPAKSHGYNGGTTERVMFWCKVLIGNPEYTKQTVTTRVAPQAGFHSVIYDVPSAYKEFIVYRYGQVKPYLMIKYTE